MKSMLKLMLILALAFASTFLIFNATGLLTLERITQWLEQAHSVSALTIGLTVTALLFADLFVAMPTLTIMLLSGYFLGPVAGAGFAIAGLTLAGFCGYLLGYRYGERPVRMLIRDADERSKAIASFRQHGSTTILLSRAVPILPEVSACMAGLTRLPLARFALVWLISTVPYACIATYAGSKSTLANPAPAIFTAIALTGLCWLGWLIFNPNKRSPQAAQ